MKAWRVHAYGEPEQALTLDEVPVPVPGPNEIRVRAEAITLNFNELDGVRGRYRTVNPDLPFIPGMEVLGRVEACGTGAEAWLGKRVVAIPSGAYGGYAEAAVCPADSAFEMPQDLPLPGAAAIYFPFHLAWLALHERGRLKSGEWVLLHAAAGGVGSAALQLAKLAGAKVIATTGSAEKVAFCRTLGAYVSVNYREQDFVASTLEATGGRGVDLVFDSVSGTVTQDSMRCMAFNSRLMMVGFASGIEAEDESRILPRPLLFGNFSICGVCHAYVADPLEFKRQTGMNFPAHADGVRLHNQLLSHLADGKIRPIVGQDVHFDELPRALARTARREVIGRSVVRL
jgi:NADPH2:quinone reductase